MTARTGLLAALVAAIVSAAVTAAGLLIFAPGHSVQFADGSTEAGTASGLDMSDEGTRTQVIAVVRDYLVNNPEILVDMSQELDERQQSAQAEQQKKGIGDNADKIFRSNYSYVGGNPDGDVTVVEFFDYNCGFCKRALPDVVKLTKEDDTVRVVFKELPIFGQDSEDAARAALAAKEQGKYFEMHQRLYNDPGKANKGKAMAIAKDLGLDMDKFEEDMKSDKVKAALDENMKIAQAIGLQGTPLYLVGDEMIAGAPDDLFEQLESNVAKIRKNGCTTTC
ncbi:disulfide isomerase/thiol-disulfide oxidase [Methyloligella halotolerans]|uniref:Disulfide isomerase/thiol-disulfide oxidase n=1 Tax=Methyloligella halotolerans TaxID=1177755 RepID=A0A1E2S2W5_9HYPH|nr:DsbA family protein [Methyloligella halotolerans]ODA68837.1 disulfide isomerase/thiol-disulfide oxidase [Methyloligella halotolerans]